MQTDAKAIAGLVERLRQWADEMPGEIAERENEASSHCGSYGTETAADYADEPDVLLLNEAAAEIERLTAALAGAQQQCEDLFEALGTILYSDAGTKAAAAFARGREVWNRIDDDLAAADAATTAQEARHDRPAR